MVLSSQELSSPAYYNNRELSWLSFNERVLEEALDEENPLLERLQFLAIVSSNLDEFFMVRVAGLQDQVKAGFNKPDNKSGMTPYEQLEKISKKTHALVERQYQALDINILNQLTQNGIVFRSVSQLSFAQLEWLDFYFEEHIYPVLTPMAVDKYRPFPMILNKSINLAVVLEKETTGEMLNEKKLAIVQVPSVLDRFISIPTDQDTLEFVLLEEVITYFISHLFRGFNVRSVTEFRITRNADLTNHEEGAQDLLKEIEEELKKRKWGAPVRLELKTGDVPRDVLSYLLKELEIHPQDIYSINGPLDLTFLFSFYKNVAPKKRDLVYDPLIPQVPFSLETDEDLFDAARERDLFFHHPYESFDPVLKFISKAAEDPETLAIKQTLYRVSGDSPIIEALKRAAENGKQVTVLVELKARFDEENNVQWAKELDKAGCHVIYGMNQLKTHSKITLIVRKKNNKIERFVHLGTGNYNDQTAKLYTDMGLITTNRKIGIDATHFFNFLSGFTDFPEFHHLIVAPFRIRDNILFLIDEEIKKQKQYGDGRIIAKMNSITDKAIIMKLYEASQAGVKIDLIVRGICCLRPGIKGISENIKVRSIVGRFLEHSRIYYFHHNGENKYFLSSADLMTRNMDARVELLFPIFDEIIKKRIGNTLSVMLSDNVKAREQEDRGEYRYVVTNDSVPKVNSQRALFEMIGEYKKIVDHLLLNV